MIKRWRHLKLLATITFFHMFLHCHSPEKEIDFAGRSEQENSITLGYMNRELQFFFGISFKLHGVQIKVKHSLQYVTFKVLKLAFNQCDVSFLPPRKQ